MADERSLGRAAALALIALAWACRSQPARPEPRWIGGRAVTSIGDGECAVFAEGKVRCASPNEIAPTRIEQPVRALASSQYPPWTARCALLGNGSVTCWGCCPSALCHPLGIEPDRDVPARRIEQLHVVPVPRATQITLGTTGACALTGTGEVWCWGTGFWGGRFEATNLGICRAEGESAPRRLEEFPQMAHIALSLDGQLCGVTPKGEVYCEGVWHSVDERQWLDAHPGQKLAREGLYRVAVSPALEIVAGEHHFCALGRDGAVSCWGDNTFEQAGAPRSSCIVPAQFRCRVGPFRIELPGQAAAVSAGKEHTCALLENERVVCWGRNANGVLGFASNERCEPCSKGFCDRVPGVVAGVEDAIAVHASRFSSRSWALTASGELSTWPEPGAPNFDPRPACSCAGHEPAISSEEALRRAKDAEAQKVVYMNGNRVRVRGRVSRVSLYGREFSIIGALLIEPLSIDPVHDQEVVVTGFLRRFRATPDAPEVWSLHALHVCGVATK